MNKKVSSNSTRRSKSRKRQKLQKRKHDPSVSRQAKKVKKTKQNSSKISNRSVDESKSSRANIKKQQIKRNTSEKSVINVKSYPKTNVSPIIDLSKSAFDMHKSTSSEKTLYYSATSQSTSSLTFIFQSKSFKKQAQKTSSLFNISLERDNFWNIHSPPESFYDDSTDNSEYAFQGLSGTDLHDEIKQSMIKYFDKKKNKSLKFNQPLGVVP